MNHALYELIDNTGLIDNGEINWAAIERMSRHDVIDFAQQATILTQLENPPTETSLFSCTASQQLGGAPFPCDGMECRTKRLDELIQFSALYGDRIYIHNFLFRFLELSHSKNPRVDNSWQSDFANDLVLLQKLRPMIEAQKIIIVSMPYHCPICLVKNFYENPDSRYKKSIDDLSEFFEKKVKISALKSKEHPGFYKFEVSGPEYLVDHGKSYLYCSENDPLLGGINNVLSRVGYNNKVFLTANAIKRSKIGFNYASESFKSILFDLIMSQSTSTSFLSSKQIEIDFLKKITDNPLIEKRNQIAMKYLTCLVPFVRNVQPADLLKLRKEEEEAFINFRASLTSAFLEYKSQGEDISERDAKAIFQDIIQPQLSSIELKIREAKNTLFEGTMAKVLGWTGAISIGLFMGFLPPQALALGATVGLAQAVAELIEYATKQSDVEANVRNESMYFLWKVRRLS